MTDQKSPSLFVPAIVLTAFIAIIAVTRLHTYHEPLEPDLATYVVMAHEMGKGRLLYSDLWDNKPPGLYCAYLAGEKIAGYGLAQIYFLGVIAAFLTLLGVFFAGHAAGGIRGGLWAAFFWTLVSGDMLMEANQPMSEAFLNVLVVWMFALMIARKTWTTPDMLAFGFLGALATLLKPQALCWIVLIPVANALLQPASQRMRFALDAFLKMILPTLGVWIILFGYFAVTRPWQDVWDTLVSHNAHYAGNPMKNAMEGLSFHLLFPKRLWFVWPLGLLAAWESCRLFKNNRKLFWLLMANFLAVYLSISCVGTFWIHYYQYWLPALAISAGWAVAGMNNKIRWLSWAVGCAVSAVLLFHEAPSYRLNALQWYQQKFQTTDFPVNYRFGLFVNEILKPGETFYIFGGGVPVAQAYFVSRRSPPSGVINIYSALLGDVRLAFKLRHRLMTQLKREKPEIIAFVQTLTGYHKLFIKDYSLWGFFPENKTYLLMVRKGGALEKRLQTAGAGNIKNGVIYPAPKIPMLSY